MFASVNFSQFMIPRILPTFSRTIAGRHQR
jgi:hypothetical protein